MMHLLLIGDASTMDALGSMLWKAGYGVIPAPSGHDGLEILEHDRADLILSEFYLRDMSALDLLGQLHNRPLSVPLIVVGSATTREAVSAMRLGAADVIDQPIDEESLIQTVRAALDTAHHDADVPSADDARHIDEAYAAARWARALAPITRSAKDPRTIVGWSRLVFVSPGALRNWCRTAGVSARRSLVFARLLRVAYLSQVGEHRLEDLLDVVDRRTLVGLMKYAGLNPERPFPKGPNEFLQQQALVRDADHLYEVRRALNTFQHGTTGHARAAVSRATNG
jgi:CheY-like chemotaxis protein